MLVNLTLRRRSGDGEGLIEKWGRALSVPRSAVEAIGEVVDQHVAERFATNTDPWGRPWAPISPVTIELRGKLGGGDEDSLAASRFMRVDHSGRRVVIGLASRAARLRHTGRANNKIFGRAPAPIPARPILPLRGRKVELPRELHDEIMATLRSRLRESVRGSRTEG